MGQGDNRTFVTARQGGVQMTPIEGAMLDHPYVQQLRGEDASPPVRFFRMPAIRGFPAWEACGFATRFFEALVRNADAEMRAGCGRPVPGSVSLFGSDALEMFPIVACCGRRSASRRCSRDVGQGPWADRAVRSDGRGCRDGCGWRRCFSDARDPPITMPRASKSRKRLARVHAPPLRLLGPLSLCREGRCARSQRGSGFLGPVSGGCRVRGCRGRRIPDGMLEVDGRFIRTKRDRGLEGGRIRWPAR